MVDSLMLVAHAGGAATLFLVHQEVMGEAAAPTTAV